MSEPTPPGPPATPAPQAADRLDSWKEIAAYLRRDVRTVQRWEKREGMPVRRHLHDKLGSVYAFRADLDAWARSRSLGLEANGAAGGTSRWSRRRWALLLAAAAAAVALAIVWRVARREPAWENPLASARFQPLTDRDGIDQAAAVSRDGRFVAFQSDRDGRMDVWLTQLGTGRFTNLTRGAAPEVVNPSVRTLGFSPDGALVTFWTRGPGATARDIGIRAVPLLGGEPRPYLDGAAELDWSADGARLVYHTPGPGDPTFVRDAADDAPPRNVFTAPEGLHAHFPLWSPDQAFVYFVQGALPDRLDLWRVPARGGTPERLTRHDALVSHPVFLDRRTLLYLALDADGLGPWIHALDLDTRVSRRASLGLDGYTSLSASADGRRLVATVARPKATLWRVPLDGDRVDLSAARRVPLPASGRAPRLGPGYLLYVSAGGGGDAVWRLQGGSASEVWRSPDARIVGGPAIRPDGRLFALSARQGGRTVLWVANADGTEARIVARALELRGAPAWAPDGESLTIAAVVDGTPRLFAVPLDGRFPTPLVHEHSVDPAWSPGGDVVVFSGADVGTTFPLKAAKADGSPRAAPPLTLSRGARRVVFTRDGSSLVVLRGELRHKNLWRVDLDTGAERQLTELPPEFDLRDFDLDPDGRALVLEEVEDRSDLVLVDLPRR